MKAVVLDSKVASSMILKREDVVVDYVWHKECWFCKRELCENSRDRDDPGTWDHKLSPLAY